jgi:hypothetical protein
MLIFSFHRRRWCKTYHGNSNIEEKLQEFTSALGKKITGGTGTCFGRKFSVFWQIKWIWNDPRLTQG